MCELLRGIVSILRTGVEGLELGVSGLACPYGMHTHRPSYGESQPLACASGFVRPKV